MHINAAIAIQKTFFDAATKNEQDWLRFAASEQLMIQRLLLGDELIWFSPGGVEYYVVEDPRFEPDREDSRSALVANWTEVCTRLGGGGDVPPLPTKQAGGVGGIDRDQARTDLLDALNNPTVLIASYDDWSMRYDVLGKLNDGSTATDDAVLDMLEAGDRGNPGLGEMGVAANDDGRTSTFTDLRAIWDTPVGTPPTAPGFKVARLEGGVVDWERLKRDIDTSARANWGEYFIFGWDESVVDPQGDQGFLLMFDDTESMRLQGWKKKEEGDVVLAVLLLNRGGSLVDQSGNPITLNT